MSKQLTLKVLKETAADVLTILQEHQSNYSNTHAPERIVRIRELITDLEDSLNK